MGPFGIRVPCAADQLLHVCVDGLQPGVGTRLPWAADAFSLCAGGDVDWQRLVTETARRQLALPVRKALRWIRAHLEAPIPDFALEQLETLPVTAAERCELRAKLDPGRLTAGLRIRWAHHARAATGRGCGRASTLAHFVPYLQQVWGLAHVGQLPFAVLRRGMAGSGSASAGRRRSRERGDRIPRRATTKRASSGGWPNEIRRAFPGRCARCDPSDGRRRSDPCPPYTRNVPQHPRKRRSPLRSSCPRCLDDRSRRDALGRHRWGRLADQGRRCALRQDLWRDGLIVAAVDEAGATGRSGRLRTPPRSSRSRSRKSRRLRTSKTFS